MKEDILSRVDLFSTLNKKELQEIAKNCQERTFSAGSTLFSQGDPGVALYVLTQGNVHISQANNPDRAEEVIGNAGVGEVLGEMALLDELPRSATVVAAEDVTVLVLPVWEFRGILRSHPDIALKMLAVLSRRLRKAEARQHD
ncbi:Crp/Fnr family transcriptional regulator [Ktedonobacter racemifer]|uniref:Putative transcriptional regulator, Crp/Fnr family n=1 Tax=Ktedonobacter racemifer DSM 44963 TaxID=485913 RepID=D6TIX4_KTERA|nr:cyclic nucleotide-binding domain-containing protein [Ktedonobacter racemifer]EFH89381.1 putative transcriptional regulator, Crp/Fnr family [Ktedonobacter racemifer DSM 44963]